MWHENPRACGVRGLLCGSGLRVALRAHNISIVVAGKLICVYFDLRLRFELRTSQPQSVLRFFCVFGGQGFFGLTKKAKARLSGWTVCGEEYITTGRSGDPGHPLPSAQFSVWACTSIVAHATDVVIQYVSDLQLICHEVAHSWSHHHRRKRKGFGISFGYWPGHFLFQTFYLLYYYLLLLLD